MPLCKTMDILADCERGKYAVGAFNLNCLDQIPYMIRKAEEKKSPLILVEPGVIEKYMDFEEFAQICAHQAAKASIPVGIHLSHGLDLEQTERAIKAGFTSVMYDGSKLPYEENVRTTKIAVEMGHAVGCAVEGELGALGSSFVSIAETMTDPAMARDFVNRTGVDILAIAIGNAHGFYHGTPSLDFKRLEEIRYAIMPYPCYITLHGGSGIPEGHLKRAIEMGFVKVCYYTEMCRVGKEETVKYLEAHPEYTGNYDIPYMIGACSEGFATAMAEAMDMYMSTGKAGELPAIGYSAPAITPASMPAMAAPAVKAAPAPAAFAPAAADAIPQNTDIGPAYPSLPALNKNFKNTGRYWDKNI